MADPTTPAFPQRKQIPTQVKNDSLVAEKRGAIVEASVRLFTEKGYHETTTREIAKASGIAIGTLYEYIQSKEDILYLVCDAIHREMEARLRDALEGLIAPREALTAAMGQFIRVCDRMQDSIILVYRETQSLAPESAKYVLRNEARMARIFERIIDDGVKSGVFIRRSDAEQRLMAHNIVVLGHMWAFRRWFLREAFSLDEYIAAQTSLIMSELDAFPELETREPTAR